MRYLWIAASLTSFVMIGCSDGVDTPGCWPVRPDGVDPAPWYICPNEEKPPTPEGLDDVFGPQWFSFGAPPEPDGNCNRCDSPRLLELARAALEEQMETTSNPACQPPRIDHIAPGCANKLPAEASGQCGYFAWYWGGCNIRETAE